jgi:hypothetical protein
MRKRNSFLVLLASVIVASAAAGSMAWTPAPTTPDTSGNATLAPGAQDGAMCIDPALEGAEAVANAVKPGCCTSNCNVDKDCDRICGKGVCACITESSCCKRCTY